jgi:hypothetical protein
MQPPLDECCFPAQALAQREQPDVVRAPWPPRGQWARYSASGLQTQASKVILVALLLHKKEISFCRG